MKFFLSPEFAEQRFPPQIDLYPSYDRILEGEINLDILVTFFGSAILLRLYLTQNQFSCQQKREKRFH